MRGPALAAVCLFAAGASSCRGLHEASVKRRLMQARLFHAEVPVSAAEARRRLEERKADAFTAQCTLCLLSSRPSGDGGTVYCLASGPAQGCVVAQSVGVDRVRFEPAPGEPLVPGDVVRELWRVMDPPAAAQAAVQAAALAAADVGALAADEEERFQGRWSFFAGGKTSALTGGKELVVGVGAQAGVRRWLGYFLLGGGGLEYESVVFLASTAHSVGLQLRAEISMWEEESAGFFNLPSISIAMTATPLLAFGTRPATGARGAVGLSLAHLRGVWAPLFLEVGYQSLVVDGADASGFRVVMGLGL